MWCSLRCSIFAKSLALRRRTCDGLLSQQTFRRIPILWLGSRPCALMIQNRPLYFQVISVSTPRPTSYLYLTMNQNGSDPDPLFKVRQMRMSPLIQLQLVGPDLFEKIQSIHQRGNRPRRGNAKHPREDPRIPAMRRELAWMGSRHERRGDRKKGFLGETVLTRRTILLVDQQHQSLRDQHHNHNLLQPVLSQSASLIFYVCFLPPPKMWTAPSTSTIWAMFMVGTTHIIQIHNRNPVLVSVPLNIFDIYNSCTLRSIITPMGYITWKLSALHSTMIYHEENMNK